MRPRPRAVAVYFGLTFLASWALWTAAALAPAVSALAPSSRALFFLPGTVMPAVVALWLTSRREGGAGTRALLDRLFHWDVGARWYVFALGFTIAVKLSAALVYRLATGAWPAFGAVPVYLLVVAAIFSAPIQAGEEIGWRGYALPRLAERFGMRIASVVLGVVWALWHLPLFVIPATTTTGQSFSVYALSVTALSVAFAWLYVNTRGSLLLAMLFHAAINNTTGVVPSAAPATGGVFSLDASPMGWITVMLLWACAVGLLSRMRDEAGA